MKPETLEYVTRQLTVEPNEWQKELLAALYKEVPASIFDWALNMMKAYGPSINTLNAISTGFHLAAERAAKVQQNHFPKEL